MELQTARGTRDIPVNEIILMNDIVSRMKNIFEKYGFNPLQTPIIERLDVLSVKFGAGEASEVSSEIFKVTDQGKRNLGLRYELTLSMCRYVAMNPDLKMPFKRYEIGRVYRDGPIKLGRAREFTQCDVDIVGSAKMIADAECIKLGLDVFKVLGLDAVMEINNRKLLEGILEYTGIPLKKRDIAIIIIDKLKKKGIKEVKKELLDEGITKTSTNKLITLLAVLNLKGNLIENMKELKKVLGNESAKKGIKEIEELFEYFSDEELKQIVFNPYLARGLTYYTGTIFEGFIKNSEITSSICGGGRYDELIKKLIGGNKELPAVGISFGLVPIMEAFKKTNIELKKSVTQIYVIPIGDVMKETLNIVSGLRNGNIKTDVDLMGRNISKNLSVANNYSIPFVLFVGENELKKGMLKIRDMKTGKENSVSLKNFAKEIKKLIS